MGETSDKCTKCRFSVHNIKNKLIAAQGWLDMAGHNDEEFIDRTRRVLGNVYQQVSRLEDDIVFSEKVDISDLSFFENARSGIEELAKETGLRLSYFVVGADKDIQWVGKLDKKVIEEIFQNSKKGNATKMSINIGIRSTYIVISFQDNGEGIPKEKIVQLGLRIGGTDHGRGTGFIRSEITKMGGTVHWDSWNKGTQVLIRFKRVSENKN